MVKKNELSWFTTPISPRVQLDGKIWAVAYSQVANWWMFDWVCLWSSLFLSRFSSKIHFVGRLYKVLVDSKHFHRNQLSLLQSSGIDVFLKLLNHKVADFILKTLKKTLSEAQCGLMNNMSNSEGIELRSTRNVGFVYLVHVFQSDLNLNHLKMEDRLSDLDVFVHFSGVRSSLIGYEKGQKKTIPFAADGLLVLAAFEEAQFDQLLKQSWYIDFIEKNTENFVGLFKREM